MAKIKREPEAVELAKQIIDTYNPKDVSDMNEALKDLFGPMFVAMLQGEMNHHMGYESNNKAFKEWFFVNLVGGRSS
jgi:hypothetical protein